MTVSIIAKNSAQGLVKGSTVSSGTITVDITIQVVHTVPTGRRQKVHLNYVIRTMGVLMRVRFRVAGALVDEVGTGLTAPPSISKNLGEYVMNSGEQVSVNSGDLPAEGATLIMTVAVLEDLPV